MSGIETLQCCCSGEWVDAFPCFVGGHFCPPSGGFIHCENPQPITVPAAGVDYAIAHGLASHTHPNTIIFAASPTSLTQCQWTIDTTQQRYSGAPNYPTLGSDWTSTSFFDDCCGSPIQGEPPPQQFPDRWRKLVCCSCNPATGGPFHPPNNVAFVLLTGINAGANIVKMNDGKCYVPAEVVNVLGDGPVLTVVSYHATCDECCNPPGGCPNGCSSCGTGYSVNVKAFNHTDGFEYRLPETNIAITRTGCTWKGCQPVTMQVCIPFPDCFDDTGDERAILSCVNEKWRVQLFYRDNCQSNNPVGDQVGIYEMPTAASCPPHGDYLLVAGTGISGAPPKVTL